MSDPINLTPGMTSSPQVFPAGVAVDTGVVMQTGWRVPNFAPAPWFIKHSANCPAASNDVPEPLPFNVAI